MIFFLSLLVVEGSGCCGLCNAIEACAWSDASHSGNKRRRVYKKKRIIIIKWSVLRGRREMEDFHRT